MKINVRRATNIGQEKLSQIIKTSILCVNTDVKILIVRFIILNKKYHFLVTWYTTAIRYEILILDYFQ